MGSISSINNYISNLGTNVSNITTPKARLNIFSRMLNKLRPVKDVFVRTPGLISYETNSDNKIILYLVEAIGESKIQRVNGTTLYHKKRIGDKIVETIFSKKGTKLYDIVHKANGSYTKKIYDASGKNIEKIISYDSSGNVLGKKIAKTARPRAVKNNQSQSLPEYFYHITSKSNYDAIMSSGQIKTSTSDKLLKKEGNQAVFLIDGQNYLTRWNTLNNGRSERSFLTALLQFCDKDSSGDIVVTKIKTSDLDPRKLKFRNQHDVFDGEFRIFRQPQEEVDEYFALRNLYEKLNPDSNLEKDIANDIYLPNFAKELSNGISMKEFGKNSDKALEILYMDNIPSNAIIGAKSINVGEIPDMCYRDIETENQALALIRDCF